MKRKGKPLKAKHCGGNAKVVYRSKNYRGGKSEAIRLSAGKKTGNENMGENRYALYLEVTIRGKGNLKEAPQRV